MIGQPGPTTKAMNPAAWRAWGDRAITAAACQVQSDPVLLRQALQVAEQHRLALGGRQGIELAVEVL